jgi:formylglycine-generating enzyme required for sulfatase activity
MLVLVTVDNTRARRTDAELRARSPLAPKVVEALVRGRLLVVSETPEGASYEIAHEALVTGWSTLARWLVEDGELRNQRHRVEVAATEWHRLGRRRDLVWSGRQLAELDARVAEGLGPREREFLVASRRARRRMRWLQRGAIAVALLAIGGTWIGTRIAHRREVARAIAEDLAQAERSWEAARAAASAARAARKAAFAAWDDLNVKEGERAWGEVQGHAREARRRYATTTAELESALVRDPDRDDVRTRYSDLLLERAILADDERRIDDRDELVARLKVYDTSGERVARLAGGGELQIDATPPDAVLELVRYDGSERTGLASATPRQVGNGAWLVDARAPGRAPVRLPLAIARGESRRIALTLPPANAVPAGFVYIPAGEGLFGSSEPEELRDWSNAVAAHPVHTDAYLIAVHETTNAEWIAYLEAISEAEREKRRPRVTSTGAAVRGGLEVSRDAAGRWQIAFQPTDTLARAAWGEPLRYPSRSKRAEQDWRRMPVAGVSFDDVQAYARWLRETERVRGARLCTEFEWERAARGTADRKFPHGATLAADDANVDITYGKVAGSFGPDEVGSHPASRSPFGVEDMTGNVWEWVASSLARDKPAARGGAFYFDAYTARVANRATPEPTFRSLTVGVRICATP